MLGVSFSCWEPSTRSEEGAEPLSIVGGKPEEVLCIDVKELVVEDSAVEGLAALFLPLPSNLSMVVTLIADSLSSLLPQPFSLLNN